MSATPLLELLESRGADADCGPAADGSSAADAQRLIAAVRRAIELRDDAVQSLAAWDEAGDLHDPETLDEALGAVAPGLGVPFLAGRRKRRLREAARAALPRTTRPGTLRLLVAMLGAVGGREDAAALETIAVHPAFTLHAATALANLGHWEGRASLLRLLTAVDGAERVLVIDRLLPHVREPAVRLALVRDAFTGLDETHAREIAPAVADTLQLQAWLDEPRTQEELRDAARHILQLAASADV